MWAYLYQPRRPSVGASHRSPSSNLSYMSCHRTDVPGIVTSFGLGVHLYADDTQLHGSCLASEAEALSRLVLRFIEAVRLWMASNRLRLNPDKTQFVWFGTRQQLAKRNCDRLPSVSLTLVQWFPTCGPRAKSGPPGLKKWPSTS